MLLLNKKG